MSEQQSTYRQIFKATSIFGGVQVFSILIAVIRSKFVAIFLGTVGVGILSLFQTVGDMIGGISNLGLNTSAVRDIAEANDSHDILRISRTLKTFYRWLFFTGSLGMTIMIVMSPFLSQWTFGNKEYTLSFILLSVTVLIGAFIGGMTTQLQGMRQIKQMAKSNVFGAALGLIISIPLYYFWGTKGIVPNMIITSITILFLVWYFKRKIKLEDVQLSFKQSFTDGINMAKVGIVITIISFISMLVGYLVNLIILKIGNMSDVGLYQSGSNIANRYVGLIFTAIITDFYPRISAINQDNTKIKHTANQQIELTLLLIAPIIILLLSTTPLVIHILYTEKFLPVVPFIQWMSLGIMFKTFNYILGFIILAKGNSKLFFITEGTLNIISLLFYYIGYLLKGLEGLGIAFMVSQIVMSVFVYFVVRYKYEYKISKDIIRIFSVQFIFCIVTFLLAKELGFPKGYFTGAIILLFVCLYSYKELNKRLNIKELITSRFKSK